MDFHNHITVINESISKDIEESKHIRFISPQKWREMMIKVLIKLSKKEFYDRFLIDDMITVLNKISEQSFIEAVIHIQPFKPNFIRQSIKSNSFGSGHEIDKDSHDIKQRQQEKKTSHLQKHIMLSNIFKFKVEIHSKVQDSIFMIQSLSNKNSLLEVTIALITQQQTLSRQFESAYHPFRKIIDKTIYLLQHKYKNYISNQTNPNLQSVQQMLLLDLNLLEQFIIKSSVPYLQIFKSKNKDEQHEFQVELIAFIKKYLEKHAKINILIKKIMKFAIKQSPTIGRAIQNIANFVDVNNFNIGQSYKINGQYSYAINSLIQFSQSQSPAQSLKHLHLIRQNILKDIHLYYKSLSGQQSQHSFYETHTIKVSVEEQLQILKFILSKVKIFLIDIVGQLKYLEIVLGQNDMSYKYDDASFMHAQLMVAFEILMYQHA